MIAQGGALTVQLLRVSFGLHSGLEYGFPLKTMKMELDNITQVSSRGTEDCEGAL